MNNNAALIAEAKELLLKHYKEQIEAIEKEQYYKAYQNCVETDAEELLAVLCINQIDPALPIIKKD